MAARARRADVAKAARAAVEVAAAVGRVAEPAARVEVKAAVKKTAKAVSTNRRIQTLRFLSSSPAGLAGWVAFCGDAELALERMAGPYRHPDNSVFHLEILHALAG